VSKKEVKTKRKTIISTIPESDVLTSYTTGQLILVAKLQHLTKYSQKGVSSESKFELMLSLSSMIGLKYKYILMIHLSMKFHFF
jgi:hypothetical protein